MSGGKDCGLCGFYPRWLRARATPKNFIAVYGLLGTIQAMAFIYIVVTLTTLEKRFKIPSRTTGIILSGNEISQILSLVLTYYGGSGHRPRWIAVGVALSAASCLVLALPHVIYGPGKDALALTKEYLDHTLLNATGTDSSHIAICPRNNNPEQCDENAMMDISYLPRLLVFVSQFILGIGTTLYYGLGQTYLDDNTKKKNTPMLLGFTFALRTIGPAVGFVLAYACLNLYIDPTLHPVITKKDPRWLGAWWLGWIILGVTMAMFAVLIAMFPRDLSKPKVTQKIDGEIPLKNDLVPMEKAGIQQPEVIFPETVEEQYVPTMREFPTAIKRILTNKLLTCNNLSGVFYVLGASAYITFLAKYLEVQYGTSAAGGTVIAGPISLIGMVLGFLLTGLFISKFKPGPRKLLAWNVFVGICFVIGQISFVFLGCTVTGIRGLDLETMQINLTSGCNADCGCEGTKYAPVCHEASRTTFYSACHAGCKTIVNDNEFGNCSCLPIVKVPGSMGRHHDADSELRRLAQDHRHQLVPVEDPGYDSVKSGPCVGECKTPYILFMVITCFIQTLACSGKIGNVLVNYRSVEKRDKSFAQGVTLMTISLFALIPGPIIYGAIIDSTCLIWEESCGTRGNCWFYHRDNFRILVNISAAGFSLIGVLFDVFVCYLVKDLDLYGTQEDGRREFVKEQLPVTLQSNRKQEVNGNANVNQRIEQSHGHDLQS
ncbi:solute carrier organic anion transporter family member 5A1 [Cephus cinctus]|uniref:Solute carrier organic anion transporter family member n=1 Tax=Cephus cinctus TaxID=211228 RepID=A0AAJ7CEZ1_CEPCN|nr:solute carrier organic anion transporter family member 5A1 [Cephus cinctus]XP_015609208.1 solute carrier organic anion transporter family member 5A1 [Cephus cinctus]XP_024947505.1 solute carrier organic anion transporter family member 5A1 [Cephus cinctus]